VTTVTDNLQGQIDLLWVLAHPDDESFGNAGTMLLAHDAGLTTGYICATRGEVGEIRDPRLATRDTLPAVREQELRRAMRLAKLTELRLLGYRDSGMAGTPENDDPRALINVPLIEAVAHVAGQIRELRPKVVVTFGPDGVYGHPDHIAIGAITDQAVLEAANHDQPGLGDPWRVNALYHVASPRERIIASSTNPESPFHAMPQEELERMGIPEDRITHWIDVSSKASEKHRIVMQHLTQISRDNPMTDAESQLAKAFLSLETYARQPLPWDDGSEDSLTWIRNAYPHRAVVR
jgi:N-acetyl-1-D-myo-inositol-2-amino-2-deoxy-alpha-D-glucopyranoside deacetylase